MNTRLPIASLVAALLAGSLSFGALAADEAREGRGWFVGIHAARADAARAPAGPGLDLPAPVPANYLLSAGYQFTPHTSAELSYVDAAGFGLGPVLLGHLGMSENRRPGLMLTGRGTLPVTKRLGVYGKVGAFYGAQENGCAGYSLACNVAERGADVSLGLGVSYDISKTLSIRGEWEQVRRFSPRLGFEDAPRDVISVGVGLRF